MKGHNVVEIWQRHNVGILGHNMHAPQWEGPGIPAENPSKKKTVDTKMLKEIEPKNNN